MARMFQNISQENFSNLFPYKCTDHSNKLQKTILLPQQQLLLFFKYKKIILKQKIKNEKKKIYINIQIITIVKKKAEILFNKLRKTLRYQKRVFETVSSDQ